MKIQQTSKTVFVINGKKITTRNKITTDTKWFFDVINRGYPVIRALHRHIQAENENLTELQINKKAMRIYNNNIERLLAYTYSCVML